MDNHNRIKVNSWGGKDGGKGSVISLTLLLMLPFQINGMKKIKK